MGFIFVDTSAWYALADKDDAEHQGAKAFIQKLLLPLITTNFVVDETITLLRYRLGHKMAAEVGRKLWKEEPAKLFFVDRDTEKKAWNLFLRYSDHKFSFTDCTSFVVMEQLGIKQAFVFDSDFESYGRFIKVP
jgi:predicted nucleic acid-binding protein